jgi:hypothetical protein
MPPLWGKAGARCFLLLSHSTRGPVFVILYGICTVLPLCRWPEKRSSIPSTSYGAGPCLDMSSGIVHVTADNRMGHAHAPLRSFAHVFLYVVRSFALWLDQSLALLQPAVVRPTALCVRAKVRQRQQSRSLERAPASVSRIRIDPSHCWLVSIGYQR